MSPGSNQDSVGGVVCCSPESISDNSISVNNEWAIRADWIEIGTSEKMCSSCNKNHSQMGLRVHGGNFGNIDLPTGTTITVTNPAVARDRPRYVIESRDVGSASVSEPTFDFTLTDFEASMVGPLEFTVEIKLREEELSLHPILKYTSCGAFDS